MSAREVLSIRGECEPTDSLMIDPPFLAYLAIRIPEDDGAIVRTTCDQLTVWGTDKGGDSSIMVTISC